MREAQIQIEELHTLAVRAPIYVKRKNIFGGICPNAEQKVPAARNTPNSNRDLSKWLHRILANRAFHNLKSPSVQ
jgi:hypothetical protein